ncbi:hypothetical protein [Desulfoferula mesophila]|uniref:Uncharacterized protein n=1 Tax=Desulfoferula mesophila TaxID=3058419 RepID=A0AAU9ETB5_9BACT|nr:hypothetical protein FAK_40720 [Desulfoferula mesophilus]
MSNGLSRREVNLPPEWWNSSLYDYTNEMPLNGWIWEFMRRARLLKNLEGRPVDAMNPEPDIAKLIEYDWLRYYRTYEQLGGRVDRAVFLPPAVYFPGTWPMGFHGQQYSIEDEQLRERREIIVDFNRRNEVIISDFKRLLNKMRKTFPEPKRMNVRIADWAGNYILQVWDLRQHRCSWRTITESINFIGGISSARNALNTASRYINKGEWQRLALRADLF